jgi:hypothetical protein
MSAQCNPWRSALKDSFGPRHIDRFNRLGLASAIRNGVCFIVQVEPRNFGEKPMVLTADTAADGLERKPVIVDENETGEWVPVLHGVEAAETLVTKSALILSEGIK